MQDLECPFARVFLANGNLANIGYLAPDTAHPITSKLLRTWPVIPVKLPFESLETLKPCLTPTLPSKVDI